MDDLKDKSTEELRAMGRACVERIMQIGDTPGMAQDEVGAQKQLANWILAELRRRR